MSVVVADCTSAATGGGATSERYECEGASGGGETGAEGGSASGESREAVLRVYTGSDDEDTSVLEDLTVMFPLLDQEVLTTVLQAHEGRVEAAIDYLMVMNCQRAEGVDDVMPDPDPQTFTEDIGGLPELIPSFVDDDDYESDEDYDDRLPSYDEIYPPTEPGPPPYSPPSWNRSYLPPSRGPVAVDSFHLPPINYLPQTESPTVPPNRGSPQTDSPTVPPSMDPPQTDSPTVTPSMDPPQTDSPTVTPNRESSPTGSSPNRESPPTDSPTEATSMDPPSVDPPSVDPPSVDPPSVDPPSVDPPSMGPPSVDPPSVDPPSVDPPSMDPPSMDPPSVDPPSMDPPQADSSAVTTLGDQHLQDSSLGAVGGGFESDFSDFIFQRSRRPEQTPNGDLSSDDDFDHRDGWQSLAGGESPSKGGSTSAPRRRKLRKFAKKLSLRKTSSKSDYKAVQERYRPEAQPLHYLPLVIDDELGDGR